MAIHYHWDSIQTVCHSVAALTSLLYTGAAVNDLLSKVKTYHCDLQYYTFLDLGTQSWFQLLSTSGMTNTNYRIFFTKPSFPNKMCVWYQMCISGNSNDCSIGTRCSLKQLLIIIHDHVTTVASKQASSSKQQGISDQYSAANREN